jgi:hypothetical protein
VPEIQANCLSALFGCEFGHFVNDVGECFGLDGVSI